MNYANEDIFISYSSKDVAIAKQIKSILEAPPRSVSCWMASDATITSGDDFRVRIVEAIRRSKVFLIILSESSMASDWCSQELSFAILENKKIYSIKIDDSSISEFFSFRLSCTQIADGTVNLDAVVESLAINVKNGRDAVIEAEEKKISEDKVYGSRGYIIWHWCYRVLSWIMLASLIGIIVIANTMFSGFWDMIVSSAEAPGAATIIALFYLMGALFIPWIITGIVSVILMDRLLSAARRNSSSAKYSLYLIYTGHNLPLSRLLSAKKASELLQDSARLNYPPAVKELERVRLQRKNK